MLYYVAGVVLPEETLSSLKMLSVENHYLLQLVAGRGKLFVRGA